MGNANPVTCLHVLVFISGTFYLLLTREQPQGVSLFRVTYKLPRHQISTTNTTGYLKNKRFIFITPYQSIPM